jgi:hypothetical protein
LFSNGFLASAASSRTGTNATTDSVSLLLIQTVDGMQSANRKFGIGTVNQD